MKDIDPLIISLFEDIEVTCRGVLNHDEDPQLALEDIENILGEIEDLISKRDNPVVVDQAKVKALELRIAVLEKMLAEKQPPSSPSYPQVPYPFWERPYYWPWIVTHTSNATNTTNMQNKKDKLS